MLTPPPPYRLREMTPADIPAVMAIDAASFPTPAPERLFINELTDNNLAHYQVLLREEAAAARVVGYAGFWLIADEVHISTIAVEPALRGRRLGELILLNLLLLACELEPILVTLEVRRGNTAAQALYRKYRFEVVGERRRYYRDTGEDAILMTVELATQPDYSAWLLGMREPLFAALRAEEA